MNLKYDTSITLNIILVKRNSTMISRETTSHKYFYNLKQQF
jgi:hypothetical protein